MSTIGELLIRLGVNTAPLAAGMAEARGMTSGFGNDAAAAGKKAEGSFNAAGVAGLALAGGVAAIGFEAIKSASAFQSSMELVRTQAGASQAEVNSMSTAILALAPTIGTGPDALATALYHVESAGIRGAKALDVVKLAAEGAKVGQADLESVTNALIAAVNSGVPGVSNMTGAMGTLNAIVGAGNMRMSDLTAAFGTGILSAAKVFGVSIQSVGGAIADMTNQGIPAVDAATRITSAIRLMAAPTSKAATELAGIGIGSGQLATDLRSPGGILTAIEDLKSHLDASGMSATQQAALLAGAFGGKQSLGILTLVGNIDKLKTAEAAVGQGAGTFGAAWAATAATTAEQGAAITASFSTIKDAIGMALLPMVQQLLATIVPVVTGIALWVSANPKLATTILAIAGGIGLLLAAGMILGPVITGIGAVIGIITSPILLVIAAIVGLAAYFGLLGSGAKDVSHSIVDSLVAAFPPLGAAINWIVANVLPALTTAFDFIVSTVIPAAVAVFTWLATNVPLLIAKAFDFISNTVIPTLGAAFNWIVTNVIPPLVAIFNWIATNVPPMVGKAFDFIANTAIPALGKAFDFIVKDVLPPLVAIFTAFVKDVLPQIIDKFATFANFLQATIPPVIEAITKAVLPALGTAIKWITTEVLPGLVSAFDWVSKNVLPSITQAMNMVTDVVLPAIGKAIGWVVTDVLPPLVTAFSWIATQVFPALSTAITFFVKTVIPSIGDAFNAVATVVSNVWNGITSAIKGAINIVIGAVDAIIGGINAVQMHIDIRPPVGPELKFDWNGMGLGTIPFLAGGSTNFPGGWAILGEKGPELAKLPGGTQVYPTGTGPASAAQGGSQGGTGGGMPSFRVFIGDRELTDLVRVEIDKSNVNSAGRGARLAGIRSPAG